MNVPTVKLKAAGYQESVASSMTPNDLPREHGTVSLGNENTHVPAHVPPNNVQRRDGLRQSGQSQELGHAYHEDECDLMHG